MAGKYLLGTAVYLKLRNIFQHYQYESLILWELISKEDFLKIKWMFFRLVFHKKTHSHDTERKLESVPCGIYKPGRCLPPPDVSNSSDPERCSPIKSPSCSRSGPGWSDCPAWRRPPWAPASSGSPLTSALWDSGGWRRHWALMWRWGSHWGPPPRAAGTVPGRLPAPSEAGSCWGPEAVSLLGCPLGYWWAAAAGTTLTLAELSTRTVADRPGYFLPASGLSWQPEKHPGPTATSSAMALRHAHQGQESQSWPWSSDSSPVAGRVSAPYTCREEDGSRERGDKNRKREEWIETLY